MTHLCAKTLEFGSLEEWSAGLNKANLGLFKEAYALTNHHEYEGQSFRFISQLEALRCRIALIVSLLESNDDLDPEVRSDIERWISFFQSRKDANRSARKARSRLHPAAGERALRREARIAEAREQRKKSKEERAKLLEAIRDRLAARGIHHSGRLSRIRPEEPEEGSENEFDSQSEAGDNGRIGADALEHERGFYRRASEKKPSSQAEARTPGPYLIGTIQPLSSSDEDSLGSIFALENNLGLIDLSGALMETLKRLGYSTRSLSRESIEDLPAKPHPTLVMPQHRFQRPDLQLVESDYRICCTPKRIWRNTGKEQHDWIVYRVGSSTILSNEKVGRLELLFSVLLNDGSSSESDSLPVPEANGWVTSGRIALVRFGVDLEIRPLRCCG